MRGNSIVATRAKAADPLDFDFEMDTEGEENKPDGRNKLVASKGNKSNIVSRPKSKAMPSVASKAKAISGRNRR